MTHGKGSAWGWAHSKRRGAPRCCQRGLPWCSGGLVLRGGQSSHGGSRTCVQGLAAVGTGAGDNIRTGSLGAWPCGSSQDLLSV